MRRSHTINKFININYFIYHHDVRGVVKRASKLGFVAGCDIPISLTTPQSTPQPELLIPASYLTPKGSGAER